MYIYIYKMLPLAQTVKRLPAMWQTWVQSLGWEDPLEKEMATHSSSLAWKLPWTLDALWDTGLWRKMELSRLPRWCQW